MRTALLLLLLALVGAPVRGQAAGSPAPPDERGSDPSASLTAGPGGSPRNVGREWGATLAEGAAGATPPTGAAGSVPTTAVSSAVEHPAGTAPGASPAGAALVPAATASRPPAPPFTRRERDAILRDAIILEGGARRSRRLVVVLHGGSWDERDTALLARRALAAVEDDARTLGLRLLAPAAPDSGDSTPWMAPAGDDLVRALVEREVAARRADGRRVGLAGHGAGATGAIHLAARHPELFAGLALWSGTPSPLWDGEHAVVGLAEDPVAALADVPVYLWTGTDDRWLDRDALRLFTGALSTRAAEDERWQLVWEQGPGGHGYGAGGPRPGLAFLAERRRPRRP